VDYNVSIAWNSNLISFHTLQAAASSGLHLLASRIISLPSRARSRLSWWACTHASRATRTGMCQTWIPPEAMGKTPGRLSSRTYLFFLLVQGFTLISRSFHPHSWQVFYIYIYIKGKSNQPFNSFINIHNSFQLLLKITSILTIYKFFLFKKYKYSFCIVLGSLVTLRNGCH